MVQGGSKINKDVPPYIKAAREPIAYCAVNSIGIGVAVNFPTNKSGIFRKFIGIFNQSGLNNRRTPSNAI
jgi:UDP-N-acetylglucosamine acyltransferase